MKVQWQAVAVLLGGMLVGTAGAADCGREDIDHYLDRGFTPQQVLDLCRPGEPAATPAAPGDSGRLDSLRDALAVFDLRLDGNNLHYSREQCVEYDRPNLAQQRKRACGKVHYSVAREGLAVEDSRRRLLFWGSTALEIVSSRIERRYELGQGALSERDREQLSRELEEGPRTDLPVRDGMPMERVRSEVEALAITP